MLRSRVAVLLVLLISGVLCGSSPFDSVLRSELHSGNQSEEVDLGLYEEESASQEGRKSLPQAVFMSIILPGAGQYYVGGTREAKKFWIAEAAVWSTYLGFQWYGGRVRNDYKLYAVSEAGANAELDSDNYYHALEVYLTSEEYNEAVRSEARDIYPDSLEAQMEYILEHSYWGEDGWSWGEASWEEYGRLRRFSRDCFLKATYCIGAAIVNRIVSVVFAAKLTKDHNERLTMGSSRIDLRFEPDVRDPGVRVVLTYRY